MLRLRRGGGGRQIGCQFEGRSRRHEIRVDGWRMLEEEMQVGEGTVATEAELMGEAEVMGLELIREAELMGELVVLSKQGSSMSFVCSGD